MIRLISKNAKTQDIENFCVSILWLVHRSPSADPFFKANKEKAASTFETALEIPAKPNLLRYGRSLLWVLFPKNKEP